MIATVEAQGVLRTFASKVAECNVVEQQNAIELVVRRNGLVITITVPHEVFEWFVDVEDRAAGLKAHDWYDYARYESGRASNFDREMAADLRSFIENIAERPLRMIDADPRKSSGVLEWQQDGTWAAAVPAALPE